MRHLADKYGCIPPPKKKVSLSFKNVSLFILDHRYFLIMVRMVQILDAQMNHNHVITACEAILHRHITAKIIQVFRFNYSEY